MYKDINIKNCIKHYTPNLLKKNIKSEKLFFRCIFFLFKIISFWINIMKSKKTNIQYEKAFEIFQKTNGQRFSVLSEDKYPCLEDNTGTTNIDKHYVYHTAWAARKLREIQPAKHIDISSFIYFSTIISAFIPVEFYDYRPAFINLSNFKTGHVDITKLVFDDESIGSLSCMHVVEHIGLGRYGDQLDPDGDLKAILQLKRVLAKNGNLLFVVPVGKKPKIMFNAHRIYTYEQIIHYFSDLVLIEFSLIPDVSNEGLIIHAKKTDCEEQQYGCGCFWFKKQ